jgi:hypothetical protein
MNSYWFKIEHAAVVAGATTWYRSLYNGKPSRFDTLDEADTALQDKLRYPRTYQYRIVRVAEEEVVKVSS